MPLGLTPVVAQPDVVAGVSEQKCEAVLGAGHHLQGGIAVVIGN